MGISNLTRWDTAKKIVDADFADQVLGFDSDAADMYTDIATSRRTMQTYQPVRRHD
jgi:hypothetical protein